MKKLLKLIVILVIMSLWAFDKIVQNHSSKIDVTMIETTAAIIYSVITIFLLWLINKLDRPKKKIEHKTW